jgi:hypothetical protein
VVEESPIEAECDIEQIIPKHWPAHDKHKRPHPILNSCITNDVLYIIEVFDNLDSLVQGQVHDILFQ